MTIDAKAKSTELLNELDEGDSFRSQKVKKYLIEAYQAGRKSAFEEAAGILEEKRSFGSPHKNPSREDLVWKQALSFAINLVESKAKACSP